MVQVVQVVQMEQMDTVPRGHNLYILFIRSIISQRV